MNDVKVILVGLGALGVHLARFALQKEGLRVVGAVDPSHDGKDIGYVTGAGRSLGITVAKDFQSVVENRDADLVIQATSSFLRDTFPQILTGVEAGLNVISTCEELSYPYYKYPELANTLDAAAKKHCVTVLGTGINPGYLMDTLPIVLSAPCTEVRRVRVRRVMYSGNRRASFQKKIGTGLSQEEFKRLIDEGKITGHVGLVESAAMLSSALGLKIDEIREPPPEPVVSDREVVTTYTTVKPGQVAGLRSVAIGLRGGREVVSLEFVAHANVKRPYDAVSIDGEPPVRERIEGGIHGDAGTVGMVFNAIPKVLNSPPGLVTMVDLPLPSACLGDLRCYVDWRASKAGYL